ncbi:MAG TPA: adenylate/guanylate cyclase domain-containing protein [Candidatus Angelobacter sp.]|jgi:class 3 adenylate cyclase|nr:adenylate/guanylate cyclase domain-containing protein [Candidatus Angelobacter sp.]
MVQVSPWLSNLEAQWDIPEWDYLFHRFAAFSRFVAFDKYGTGMSDPAPVESLPTLEEWADDVQTVMDAVGSKQATLLGIADGGIMAALFAATHPKRTRFLVLLNSAARMSWAPDYPIGIPADRQEAILGAAERAWGGASAIAEINPTADRSMLESWSRLIRLAASPATGRAVWRMLFALDVRAVLSSVQAPTLVLWSGSPLLAREHSQYLADHIPGARLRELSGSISHPTMRDMDEFADAVEEFVSGARGSVSVDRMLTTVLFTDIVGSTQHLAQVGDRQWKEMLDTHDRLAEQLIARYRGRLIDRTGDGLLASFDGPARAIRFGLALRDSVRTLGMEIRVGLHTGEVERRGDYLAGLTVHIAARIQALAGPGEVLVSRTVKDIVAGAGFEFTNRGNHALKGVPDEWELFAVKAAA